MSRMPDINDWISCPDDMPSYAVVERDEDTLPALPVHRWTAAEVETYRATLERIGLSSRQIEDQIEATCGVEWCQRPMLSVAQAGGVR